MSETEEAATKSFQPEKKRRRKRVVTALVVALSILSLPFVLVFLMFYSAAIPMLSVADRLEPIPGWNETDTAMSGGPVCFSMGLPCESMWREYHADQDVTTDDLQRVIDASGYDLEIKGNCVTDESPETPYSVRTCSATGVVWFYDVEIEVYDGDGSEVVYFKVSNTRNR